jgi:hypothetical protein
MFFVKTMSKLGHLTVCKKEHNCEYYTYSTYFSPKTIFIPPPLSENYTFSTSHDIVFLLSSWPFYLNSSLFCIFLLFDSFTLSLFLSPFFVFFYIFPFFSSPVHTVFFPQMTLADIPPPGGGGIFSNTVKWANSVTLFR